MELMTQQRCLLTNMTVGDAGDMIGISTNHAIYMTAGNTALTVYQEVSANLPIDASPRELINAFVQAAIDAQPVGYDLQAHDVLVVSLERG